MSCVCPLITYVHLQMKKMSVMYESACDAIIFVITVKSRLSERRLSETTGLFEGDGQSRIFSLLSIAIKLPIIRISIIRKIQFSEVIRRSRLKKVLLITLQDSKSKSHAW